MRNKHVPDDEPIEVPRALDADALADAVWSLAGREPVIAASVERFGTPPLWSREASFATLVHLILEQQVSLASALAAFERLRAALGGDVTPAALLELDDGAVRAIGFSRQKSAYARELALAMLDGFDLGALRSMTDDQARAALVGLRGIGAWTADVYLTMCLLRPDVWPHGDQALVTGTVELLGLRGRPRPDALAAIAERWRPFRGVAARVIWHDYLRRRGRPA